MAGSDDMEDRHEIRRHAVRFARIAHLFRVPGSEFDGDRPHVEDMRDNSH